jgi:hypothetical protein
MRALSIAGRVVGVVLALAAGSASYVAAEALPEGGFRRPA